MRKLLITAMAVMVLLLASCAGPGGEVEATETVTTAEIVLATEAESTSEAPTIELAQGETNGVSWRVIELSAEARKDLLTWTKGNIYFESNKQEELKLSDDKTVVIVRENQRHTNKIILRNADGSEVLLLEHTTTIDPYEGVAPFLSPAINERYILITWLGMGC